LIFPECFRETGSGSACSHTAKDVNRAVGKILPEVLIFPVGRGNLQGIFGVKGIKMRPKMPRIAGLKVKLIWKK